MKHTVSLLFVFANITKNGFCKVFHHIFSLGLLPFFNVFLFFIPVLMSLLWRAVYLSFEVDFLKWARM